MIGKVLGRSAIVAAALLAVAPASATSFVFTNSGNTNTSGAFGNTFSMTSGGITVTARAWSATTTSATPAAAYLGVYSGSGGGLGVTNVNEGSGGNPKHTIDNLDGYDFVMLTFSQAVNLTSINKNNYDISGGADGDYWYSFGSASAITASNWTTYLSNSVSRNSGDAVASNPNTFATVWLIGAARTPNEKNDGFKLSAVNVITPQVPEPATWLTMILGFGAIGGMVRRRAQIAAKVRTFLANTLGRKLLTGPTA